MFKKYIQHCFNLSYFYNLEETDGDNIGNKIALRYEPNGCFNERFCNCVRICIILIFSTWYVPFFSYGTRIPCIIKLDIVVLIKSIDKE